METLGTKAGSRGAQRTWGRPRRHRRVWAIASFFLVTGSAVESQAGDPYEDPYDVPDAPRAPTLPELAHRDVEVTSETTLGFLVPSTSSTGQTSDLATALVERLNAEVPLFARRWFAGGNYEFTTGNPPFGRGHTQLVSGNLELYGRTVWATRTGLALGGGLALVAPIANFDEGSPAARIANAAASVRPWDNPMFASGYFTARPFFDVRAVDGGFVIQFRQGLDASVPFSAQRPGRLAAIEGLYLGYGFSHFLGLGLEVFEYYVLQGPVADNRRVNVFVSPSVRLLTRAFQPTVSLYHSLGTPLDEPGAPVAPVWGLRLALTFVVEKP